jgi:hypothetical protein
MVEEILLLEGLALITDSIYTFLPSSWYLKKSLATKSGMKWHELLVMITSKDYDRCHAGLESKPLS